MQSNSNQTSNAVPQSLFGSLSNVQQPTSGSLFNAQQQPAPGLFGGNNSSQPHNSFPPLLGSSSNVQQPSFGSSYNFQQQPAQNLFIANNTYQQGLFPPTASNTNASSNPFQAQIQAPPTYQQVPPQSIFSNSYGSPYIGNFSFQQSYQAGQSFQQLSFKDDQLIPQKNVAKQQKIHVTLAESKIDFTLASQFQQIRLGSSTTLPCLCSITGVGGARASVDVLCLIDQSGSMSGQKIQLVRDTMKYVLKMLTPKDRLSIAVYENQGTRLCPFKFVNKDNEKSLLNIVNNLRAGGGNIMINGLGLAIKMLRQRRTRNEVTSIFLLSDGQEPTNTDQLFKQMLEKEQNKDLGSFSLHSFGFGNDHDQNLMTKVCSLKDGNFYFINKLSTLDEAFCNALGGIITQTASDIEISVECIAPPPVQGIRIDKVYGNKWNKVNDNKYTISISQMMSQVPKDFVFELLIPKIAFQALDANRSLQILQASYTAKDTITGGNLQGQTRLKLEFFDESTSFKRQSNPVVVEPYFRLLAVETMNNSIKLAEQGNFDQAKKQIDDILQTIKYHPNIRKDKVKGLIEDLQFAKKKCTRQVFQSEGRKQIVNLCYANSSNTSYQFSNNCQQQMLFDLKQSKKS